MCGPGSHLSLPARLLVTPAWLGKWADNSAFGHLGDKRYNSAKTTAKVFLDFIKKCV